MRLMRIGIGIGRVSGNVIISATASPTMSQIANGAQVQTGFTSGTYTTSASGETISTEVATYYVNGSPVAGTTTVSAGDSYYAVETVTDTGGNSRDFATATLTNSADVVTFDSTAVTFDSTAHTFDEAS